MTSETGNLYFSDNTGSECVAGPSLRYIYRNGNYVLQEARAVISNHHNHIWVDALIVEDKDENA